ncbi:MAG TPA: hypothetical protein VHT73_16425 [Thermodesulfobacteriota bacterium]|nr:hypothetical protein [Thermodesulfobacteriota bacterium]
MIIPFRYICRECNRVGWVYLNQEDLSFPYKCDCGYEGSVFLSRDYTIGTKILCKSEYELEVNKDYPLSIVLSAAAFECELSRLYFKWTELDKNEQGEEISSDELEDRLRDFGKIKTKIKKVAKLLNPEGINNFVRNSRNFSEMINTDFPYLDINNLPKSFQEKLFWLRNRVLHFGYSNYNEEDARRCLDITNLGIELFNEMDRIKRNS